MVGILDTLVWLHQDWETTVEKQFEPRLRIARSAPIANDNAAKKADIADYEKKVLALEQNLRDSCLKIKEPGESEDHVKEVLERYNEEWLEKTKHHLGYPINSDFDYSALNQLNRFALNNVGDPFIVGGYGVHSRDFEVGVLNWFADLWGIDRDKYWGYTTNGGSEGNLHGLLLGRIKFEDGILYTSKESHYSVFKAAYILRINCHIVDTLSSGEINITDLENHLKKNADKPAIVNVNIGTTLKGAIDDLDRTIETLKKCGFPRERFYIHCDGALSSIMLPFMDEKRKVTFKKDIDSICVSGHKFVGCPMPCGVQIAKLEHVKELTKDHEYIATRDATITGSRNGHTPIFLWYALNRKGRKGLEKEVDQCLENAKYLKDQLKSIGVSAMLNDLSIIVVFERPPGEEFVRRWQLACKGNIAHVCVMPHVTKEKLDRFLTELTDERKTWYKDGGKQPPCVASDIGKENCACPKHKMSICS